jgi:NAD(P)-dependent dehydrogenase (short-subunit alcohol dehydrogenase family)
MTTATSRRQPELTRQTVVVIGGGADLVLETARRARAEGAGVILTGRKPGLLERAAAGLPEQIGPVIVTARRSCLPLSLGGLPCIS